MEYTVRRERQREIERAERMTKHDERGGEIKKGKKKWMKKGGNS